MLQYHKNIKMKSNLFSFMKKKENELRSKKLLMANIRFFLKISKYFMTNIDFDK